MQPWLFMLMTQLLKRTLGTATGDSLVDTFVALKNNRRVFGTPFWQCAPPTWVFQNTIGFDEVFDNGLFLSNFSNHKMHSYNAIYSNTSYFHKLNVIRSVLN